jgi:hypothetical protein
MEALLQTPMLQALREDLEAKTHDADVAHLVFMEVAARLLKLYEFGARPVEKLEAAALLDEKLAEWNLASLAEIESAKRYAGYVVSMVAGGR